MPSAEAQGPQSHEPFGAAVHDLSHRYSSDAWALHHIDFTLEPGVTALVGVNGAGKSTLLLTMAGALRPTHGSVTVKDVDLFGRRRRDVLPRVALMPQTLTMPSTLTVLEAVSVIAWMRGVPSRQSRERASSALVAVDLHDQSDRRIRELSGGMKRRVALAQALVTQPDILLLDEPSTGLDPQQRRRMVDLVKDLPGTVLLSSHVMEDIVDTADRVLVLHEGRILFDGDLQDLGAQAPHDTVPSRRAEAAFLSMIATHRTALQ